MRNALLLLCIFATLASTGCKKNDPAPEQDNTLYFPPVNGTTWETTTPQALGWNTTAIPALTTFLQQTDTRAFLVLKDGRIVMEHYFGNAASGAPFTATSNWYWASAGKTLTAFMVGVAQQNRLLSIQDRTSKYLGTGWTSLQYAQEEKITIRHQLTMMTGLNDLTSNKDCTDPSCLTYLAAPGTRWAYHNAPYTLLTQVVAAAAKQNFNTYFDAQLKNKIGMDGLWTNMGENYVYVSTARSMARFGLLMLNKGNWDGTPVLQDQDYISAMLTPSQELNKAYGYLWWLNGQESYMVPTLQRSFPGSMVPAAPTDMVAAIGKNGQLLNIIPSQNLIVIRMGENPDNADVSLEFENQLWEKLQAVLN